MIVEWLLSVAAGLWEFLGTLVPDWEVPAAITDPGGFIETIVAAGAGAGVWVDWPFVVAVGLLPLAVWVIGLLWKVFRMLVSHIPQFGGSG